MTKPAGLSHVASPRECDTRHRVRISATDCATSSATTLVPRPSVRELARDSLGRQGRDKATQTRATSLRQSIERCCDLRGDDEANRAALIVECLALPMAGQEDVQEHFEQEAERWEWITK